jgi:hypothetical protein
MVTPHIMQEARLRGKLEQYNLTLVYMYWFLFLTIYFPTVLGFVKWRLQINTPT